MGAADSCNHYIFYEQETTLGKKIFPVHRNDKHHTPAGMEMVAPGIA